MNELELVAQFAEQRKAVVDAARAWRAAQHGGLAEWRRANAALEASLAAFDVAEDALRQTEERL